MARISRGELNAASGRAQIQAGSSSGIGALGSAVGRAGQAIASTDVTSLSRQISDYIDNQGKQIYSASKEAHQSGLLLNKTTEATERFLQAKQERYKGSTDAQGNPNFQNLHTDIESIGKDIMNEVADTIIDPEVSQAFRQRFNGYVANQKISALKEGVKKQAEYARSQLDVGLGNILRAGVADEIEQLTEYEQQGLESLQQALAAGTISPEQFERMSVEFSVSLREGALQTAAINNRTEAKNMLQQSPEQLGIPEESRNQILQTIAAAERSDEVQVKKAQQIQKIDETVDRGQLANQLEEAIDADALREDELLSMQSRLEPKRFSQLKRKYLKAAEKRSKEREENLLLAHRISNGDDISDVTPAKISQLYDYAVSKSKPQNLAEEAQLASGIPAPVKRFAEKLEGAAQYGSPEKAQEILSAYTYVKDRDLPTLDSNFNKTATNIMEHAEFLVEKAGISPQEALTQSRELINSSTDETRKFNISLFKKIESMKPDAIIETASSELAGAESFFGTNRVTNDVAVTYKKLVEESYASTGSIESAKAYAKRVMSQNHGVSEITGEPTYMANPPEKLFPGIPSSQLRAALEFDAKDSIPEGADIVINSDPYTRGTVQVRGVNEFGEQITKEVPTWIVSYKDEEGEIIPVLNPLTGKPMRWTPAGSEYFNQDTTQEKVDKALEDQELVRKIEANRKAIKAKQDGKPSPFDRF